MTPPRTTRIAVVGAGSVGLSLGARLAAVDFDVLLLTRRAEQARCIARDGVKVTDPASGQAFVARPSATALCEANTEALGDRTTLVCVRAADTASVSDALAARAPALTVASAQNDVDNEETLARRFARVLGVVVRQTCTRTGDAGVNALGRGRLVVGVHAGDAHADARALTAALRDAGFDTSISARIREDKWLKLCINLMSVPNALIDPAEHERADFVEIKARLLEEARDVLTSAGIAARSCDGRDRSLDEEIVFQRESLRRGESARRLPVYNAVWAALRHGAPLEAERYHERILALARAHDVPAPMNARALDLLREVARTGRGPECLHCADFVAAQAI